MPSVVVIWFEHISPFFFCSLHLSFGRSYFVSEFTFLQPIFAAVFLFPFLFWAFWAGLSVLLYIFTALCLSLCFSLFQCIASSDLLV